jgi:hypothetical protein
MIFKKALPKKPYGKVFLKVKLKQQFTQEMSFIIPKEQDRVKSKEKNEQLRGAAARKR